MQEDVLRVQGTPDEITQYRALGKVIWSYGYSNVTFSLPDERVIEWADNANNLKVKLQPKSGQSATPGYFTLGSSQDDVLHAQGTPDEITQYRALGKVIWSYGYSNVTFSLPDERVIEWADNANNLKVKLQPKSGQSATPGYFTLGSSQDDVLHAQGTPDEITQYRALGKVIWSYGYSNVTFSLPDERVIEWADNANNLKVKLQPKSGQSATPGYFTLGSSQDDVLHAQGTPDEITQYRALGKVIWSYGYSNVTFSLPDERVIEWSNNDGDLKVR